MNQATFGLMGASLKHTLSPIIHNAVFKKFQIDAQYRIFELEKEQVGKFLSRSFTDSIRGVNVTVPYKELVMQFLTKLDEKAGGVSGIGAVNTIKIEEKGLIGYNTDGDGFIDALNTIQAQAKNEQVNFKDKICVILGAGGAAKAVCFALASHAVKHLFIYDIDKLKAQQLASRIKAKFLRTSCEALQEEEQLGKIKESDILVNATPVGMKATDAQIVNEDFLHKDLFVFDCVYNPSGRKTTLLVETARERGARAFDGLWMLICQAIRSQKIWLGKQIPDEGVFEIMSEALKKEGFCLC